MTLTLYKTVAALLIFLISLLTSLYPLRKKNVGHIEATELGEALASGIFLGAAFFHMLPDSVRLFSQFYGNTLSYPLPELICVTGFLVMLFLERLSLTSATETTQASVFVLVATLTVHAFTEGAALGIGPNLSETIMLFIAILAHKGSESFALCMILLRYKLPVKQILPIVLFFSFMTPLGIALGTSLQSLPNDPNREWVAAFITAFAAGSFLYISTLHHIHFHQHKNDKRGLVEFMCLLVGATVMALIAVWA